MYMKTVLGFSIQAVSGPVIYIMSTQRHLNVIIIYFIFISERSLKWNPFFIELPLLSSILLCC